MRIEIKFDVYNLHNMAVKGSMPQHYLDQMQHQLLVIGAENYFFSEIEINAPRREGENYIYYCNELKLWSIENEI